MEKAIRTQTISLSEFSGRELHSRCVELTIGVEGAVLASEKAEQAMR